MFFKSSHVNFINLFSLVILKEKVKKSMEGPLFVYHHADDDNFRPSSLPKCFV